MSETIKKRFQSSHSIKYVTCIYSLQPAFSLNFRSWIFFLSYQYPSASFFIWRTFNSVDILDFIQSNICLLGFGFIFFRNNTAMNILVYTFLYHFYLYIYECIHPFSHSLIQMYLFFQLCVSHCSTCQRYNREQKNVISCPKGHSILQGKFLEMKLLSRQLFACLHLVAHLSHYCLKKSQPCTSPSKMFESPGQLVPQNVLCLFFRLDNFCRSIFTFTEFSGIFNPPLTLVKFYFRYCIFQFYGLIF